LEEKTFTSLTSTNYRAAAAAANKYHTVVAAAVSKMVQG